MAVQGHSPSCPGMAATGAQVVSRALSFNAVVRLRACAFKTRSFVRNSFGGELHYGKDWCKNCLGGNKMPPPHCENHQDQGPSRLSLAKSTALQARQKVRTGGITGKENFNRLPGGRGCKTLLRLGGDQAPGSLVCHFQGGKGGPKTSSDLRLQDFKSIFLPQNFQVVKHQSNSASPEDRLVWGKGVFK